jgi:hypothetical protein
MSTSSSSDNGTQPAISVVIGSTAPPERLEACLTALEGQRDGDVEVLVHESHASPTALRERFPWVRFADRPDALVPELWRDGIDTSQGEIVALTIAQMVPAPDWIAQIRSQHRRFDAVAGAIEPGKGLRLTDWAEYFCRYARDMLPFPERESLDLPGDNAAYKRTLLGSVHELYRDGFWEPVVHKRLAADGVHLRQAPELVVELGRSSGWRAFTTQRLRHGRTFGHQRGAGAGKTRALIGLLAAPIVPLLMTWRVLGQVLQKRRHRARLLAVLPILFSFNVAWALAEARGYLDILRGR